MGFEQLDRRHFGKAIAATAVGSPLMTSADDDKQSPQKAGDNDSQKKEQPPKNIPAREDELLLEVVKQRYSNENLTEEVLQHIQRSIQGSIARGRLLSSYPLKNADEPGFLYGAYRPE